MKRLAKQCIRLTKKMRRVTVSVPSKESISVSTTPLASPLTYTLVEASQFLGWQPELHVGGANLDAECC